jgi:nicotinate-nucleotide pyrophosphorylase (carboxylating)
MSSATPRPAPPAAPLVDAIIDRALEEDLAGGDLTSEACVDADVRARAVFVARSPLVACGLDVAVRVFERLRPPWLEFGARVDDGRRCAKGDALLEVRGPARALLAGERVALNLVQRMSGVATVTRTYVDAIPAGSRTRVVDTRKTTPGLRVLERYAVRCGGGWNHRDSLGSAVLIKDNHIVAAGGVARAIGRARAQAPHSARIECEVESTTQLDEALAAGADVVLLDNMDDAAVAAAVGRVRAAKGEAVVVEASGGITLARIPALARAGVDVISVGALTHSAPAADVALDLFLDR